MVGKTSITIDNVPMQKVSKNFYTYTDRDNVSYDITVIGNEFKGMDLQINGTTINILRKLKVYEFIFALFPIYLILGGAIGGAIAGAGIVSIISLCRKVENFFLKFLVAILCTLALTGIYVLIANILNLTVFQLLK